ncbi:MAG: aminotransferase class I/II-fold pyridoxal phosphate-dependent enzyme [Leptospiraceae bacterium]|nr:aminotransferase class I/II-fold pyridoxal phosphate-dependent enzyme [Leptospiraceae bacterium]MDW8307393.1 aminotransferase class I/II-fold pyridoxal phosphate-dependent enzyme [Leptospiraceae bacterium]
MTQTRWAQCLNATVLQLKPSGIRQFFDLVASRPGCISLGVGEPDFVSPQPVIEKAISALREGYTHYTTNQGLLSLRQAIARYLYQEYGLVYDPKTEILITVGVSQALDLSLRTCLNPGDGVLYPQPGYVSYEPMILLSQGRPIPYNLNPENGFRLDFPGLEKTLAENPKIILLNYPANPTGMSFHQDELKELARWARQHNLLVISDEIYGELTYSYKHIPIASLPDMKERTLLLGGFSKSFAMTGWRLGYVCGPREIVEAMTKVHQFSMLCAPTLSQIAAEAALSQALAERDQMKEAYRVRRDTIVHGLNEIGLVCHLPDGAFYVFADIRCTGLTSMEFATKLLERENVAVVPGTAFGSIGEGFIRCSYATSLEEIKEALLRMKRFLHSF